MRRALKKVADRSTTALDDRSLGDAQHALAREVSRFDRTRRRETALLWILHGPIDALLTLLLLRLPIEAVEGNPVVDRLLATDPLVGAGAILLGATIASLLYLVGPVPRWFGIVAIVVGGIVVAGNALEVVRWVEARPELLATTIGDVLEVAGVVASVSIEIGAYALLLLWAGWSFLQLLERRAAAARGGET